jgi:translation initiation factor IF-2
MEYNCTPIVDQVQGKDLYPREKPSDPTKYPLRPPVVTIMGHVDHGKTTLLDKLRNSSIAAGEAGGITQHIGAFSVITKSKNNITFLDTPGHAAFSQMRARGANTTDIVVLVVAIDDGIMPQTVEAIKHAQEAEVPIIVAITKCDKHNNNLEQIKIDFVQHGVYLEESGGEVPLVKLSAVTGEGIDELEETILAVSEVLDVRADPKGLTQATVLESRVDKGLGNTASVLVNYGTLKPGQLLVAGTASGKVRLMFDEHGKQIKLALPGTPVQITGWKTLPNAGEYALEAKDEDEVKVVVANRERDLDRKKEMEQIEAINEQKQQLHELSKIKQQNKALGIEEEDDKRTYQPKTPEKPCLNVILKGFSIVFLLL